MAHLHPAPVLFDDPPGGWNRLSPRYVTVRRLSALVFCLIIWIPATVASWFILGRPEVTAAVGGVGLLWTLWRVIRARRWVQSFGWAERDRDLIFVRGLMTRQQTVVPIGRMQVVEVSSGPFLRWQKLANVQLTTAAMASDATIPGLELADAAALRDRLIDASDAEGSGL